MNAIRCISSIQIQETFIWKLPRKNIKKPSKSKSLVSYESSPIDSIYLFKRVPVYMFNLYQNQRLTKDMIELEQLDKCKLAFWLCIKENENYIRISPESFSSIITESQIFR